MLDFTKKEKKKYKVKLHDGFVAILPMPDKGVFDKMISYQDMTDFSEAYELLGIIINQNQKKKYSRAKIEAMFDLDDAVELLKDYLNFVTGVVSNPN